MPRATTLVTDSGCDLPIDLLGRFSVKLLPFPYTLDGKEHIDDLGQTLSYEKFYGELEAGVHATTSQVRQLDCEAVFRQAYAENRAVVLLTISSGLSGSFDSAESVRRSFMARNPDAEIHVIDSLSVSAGQGLLVLEMARRLAEGASAGEVAAWAVENRSRVHHLFTVESFDYLVRGGRISPTVASAGSILNVKPIMRVNAEGRLVAVRHSRGRRRSVETLVDMAVREMDGYGSSVVVGHACCAEDADDVRRAIVGRTQVDEVIVSWIGVIIGAHVGPGGLVVAFWGSPRGALARSDSSTGRIEARYSDAIARECT